MSPDCDIIVKHCLCHTLSILFYLKNRCRENVIVQSLAELNTYINRLTSKHSICSLSVSTGKMKESMWKNFVDATDEKRNTVC